MTTSQYVRLPSFLAAAISSVRRTYSSADPPWKAGGKTGGSWAPGDVARPTTAAAASTATLRTYFIAPPKMFCSASIVTQVPFWQLQFDPLSSVVGVFGNENDDVLWANRHCYGFAGTQSARRLDRAHLDTVDGKDILLFEAEK